MEILGYAGNAVMQETAGCGGKRQLVNNDKEKDWSNPGQSKKRVLSLCYEHPPLGGGGGRFARSLNDHLGEQGFDVDQISMRFAAAAEPTVPGNVVVHPIEAHRRDPIVCTATEMAPYVVRSAMRALSLMRQARYDYNLSHFIFPDGLACLVLKWRTGLPYVIIAHGSDVPGYNPHRFTLLHRLLGPVWRAVVRNAVTIVCPSASVQRLIQSVCPDARTVIIPNGIDPERFVHDRRKVDRILVVTRMLERKGVQYLIEALGEMTEPFELHVVGDGPYLPVLRALAEARSTRITFHGALMSDSTELRELYETSRIFAFPSEAENFPLVLLEAMAAGCAIVTSAYTGCAEVVGDEALLVPPRNVSAIRAALTRLMADPDLCSRMGIGARRRVEDQFAWDRIVGRYVAMLESTRWQSVEPQQQRGRATPIVRSARV